MGDILPKEQPDCWKREAFNRRQRALVLEKIQLEKIEIKDVPWLLQPIDAWTVIKILFGICVLGWVAMEYMK